MALANFRMLNIELLKKDLDMVPEQAPPIVLDRKSDICMTNNGLYNKQTIHISIRINLLRNVEEFNLHKKLWCEGCLQMEENRTKNVRKMNLILD